MASIVVGSVAVDVVPNATNFASDLRGQIEGPVDAVGQEVGQNLSDAVIDHLSGAIPEGLAAGVPESAQAGDESGARFADAFSTQIRTKIDAALKSLPAVDVDANTDPALARIQEIKEDLLSLDGYIDIRGNEDQVLAQLEDIRGELEVLSLASPDIRVRVDAAQAHAEVAELIGEIYSLDAAQQALGASMAADTEEFKVFAGSVRDMAVAFEALDLAEQEQLGEMMAADVEALAQGFDGASSSVSGLAVALAGVALVAAPILGVAAAAVADLVIGIKNAHVETGDLSTAWQSLEAEAGKAIQPGLQTAVDGLARAIPALNPLVDTLGSDIGGALGELGDWLGDGGAKEIVDYLKEELPVVGGLFKSVFQGAGDFIHDTQDAANGLMETLKSGLDILNSYDKLRNSLPSVPTGNKGVGGFFEDAAAFATGNPQGLIAGAGIGAGWISDAAGAVGNGVSSAFGAATSSASGQSGPLNTPTSNSVAGMGTNSSWNGSKPPSTVQPTSSGTPNFMPSIEPQGPQLNSQALHDVTSGLDTDTVAWQKNADAAGETVGAYQTAMAAAAAYKTQSQANVEALLAENQAGAALAASLGKLGTNQLGVAQSGTQFEQSVLGVSTALAKNGDVVTLGTGKLNANSGAVLDNQSAIEGAVAAAQAHAEAVGQQTGSIEQMTNVYNQDIATLKNQVSGTDAAKGKINEYIDSIDQIPTLHKTSLDIDDAEALETLASFKAQVNGTAAITSEALSRSAAAGYTISPFDNADGNFLTFYADGGMENHVAQMAPAGAMRVWAEPETGGESYIPHAASKRVRSEAILSATANLFGGQYIPRSTVNAADGFVMHGDASGSGGGGQGSNGHEHPINVILDGKKITKAVNEQNQFNKRLGG